MSCSSSCLSANEGLDHAGDRRVNPTSAWMVGAYAIRVRHEPLWAAAADRDVDDGGVSAAQKHRACVLCAGPTHCVDQRGEQGGAQKLCGAGCIASTATCPSIWRATGGASRSGALTTGTAPVVGSAACSVTMGPLIRS